MSIRAKTCTLLALIAIAVSIIEARRIRIENIPEKKPDLMKTPITITTSTLSASAAAAASGAGTGTGSGIEKNQTSIPITKSSKDVSNHHKNNHLILNQPKLLSGDIGVFYNASQLFYNAMVSKLSHKTTTTTTTAAPVRAQAPPPVRRDEPIFAGFAPIPNYNSYGGGGMAYDYHQYPYNDQMSYSHMQDQYPTNMMGYGGMPTGLPIQYQPVFMYRGPGGGGGGAWRSLNQLAGVPYRR